MSIIEEVKEAIYANIDSSERKIVGYKKMLPLVVWVAEKLEENSLKATFYGSTFEFNPVDSKESFIITAKLLEIFPEIERFTKEFINCSSLPMWKWIGGIIKDEFSIQFTVKKATPEEDCIPRQEVHTYKSWVCGRRE